MNNTEKTTDSRKGKIIIWGTTILLAVILGIFLDGQSPIVEYLTLPAFLVLRVLVALAVPMFFLVIMYNLITIKISNKTSGKLLFPILSNTTFAILIGFVVTNLFRPGSWGLLIPFQFAVEEQAESTQDLINIDNFWDVIEIIKNLVPTSLVQPLVDNNVIQIIVVAFSLGIVLRRIKFKPKEEDKTDSGQNKQMEIDPQPLEDVIKVLLEAVQNIWEWVIKLLPLAVFGILLKNIATEDPAPLFSLIMFVLTMLAALFLQACYYLLRIKFGSWMNPFYFLRQGSQVFRKAFTTASSSSTLDTASEILKKIPLRETSVRLGVDIGSKFNRNGTIILMVTSVLYIFQMLGQNLSLGQLFFLILTSIFASIGGAGIPNAGLVTLTLVFTAVGLPIDYIAVIVVVDWLLDGFYTLINVMGYMTISVLLDGKKPYTAACN